MNNLKEPLTAVVDDLTPVTQPPFASVAARVGTRRKRRVVRISTACSFVLLAASAGALLTNSNTSAPDPSAPSSQASLDTAAPTGKDDPIGEVPFDGTYACVRGDDVYSPEQVLNAQFSLDGTITKIDPPSKESSIGGPIVTVSVHEWFRGGTAHTARVQMWPPADVDGNSSYDVGSRLLISGDHGPGRLITGWPCGATRYYDPATADRWRDLTR